MEASQWVSLLFSSVQQSVRETIATSNQLRNAPSADGDLTSLRLMLKSYVENLHRHVLKLGASLCVTPPESYPSLITTVAEPCATAFATVTGMLCQMTVAAGGGTVLCSRLNRDVDAFVDAMKAIGTEMDWLTRLEGAAVAPANREGLFGPATGRALDACKRLAQFPTSIHAAVTRELVQAITLLRDVVSELQNDLSDSQDTERTEPEHTVAELRQTPPDHIMEAEETTMDGETAQLISSMVDATVKYLKALVLVISGQSTHRARCVSREEVQLLEGISNLAAAKIPQTIDAYCTQVYMGDTKEAKEIALQLRKLVEISLADLLEQETWDQCDLTDLTAAKDSLIIHIENL